MIQTHTMDVGHCGHCESGHGVEFERLANLIDGEWRWIGSCPTTGLSILMVPGRRESTGEKVHVMAFPSSPRDA
jgi:hypothetical protein